MSRFWLFIVCLSLACRSGDSAKVDPAPVAAAPTQPGPATNIGAAACGECHATELSAWRGSDHDLAMQLPSPTTVLGDFDNQRFTHRGEETRFYRKGSEFLVEALDAEGKRQEFVVRYVFGHRPLQQLLLDVGAGRLQALSVAWDSRPSSDGGQRWFHLDPETGPGDALHWTGASYQWNDMCADCHSTKVALGYDAKKNTYNTTYAEINVACEACHGPGSRHAAWAIEANPAEPNKGLSVALQKPEVWPWIFEPDSPIAKHSGAANPSAELDTCAGCHSRRAALGGTGWFNDRYRVATLSPDLYYPDGQIKDEVFVYGSFVQSRMHAAGVVCSDCHDPHTLKLRAEGNALCATCHKSDVYATSTHHLHKPDSPGAQCVSCHMPERLYMGVDWRSDHRFGVPRPDLSETLGTPNACTRCHKDKGAKWAEMALKNARGGPTKRKGFAAALAKARAGRPQFAELLDIATDRKAAGIVRATVVLQFTGEASPEMTQVLGALAGDADPIVRRAVAEVIMRGPSADRLAVAVPLVTDPVRSVRIQAASAFLGQNLSGWPPAQRKKLGAAFAELRAAREATRNRAESMVDLAHFAQLDGDAAESERLLRAAIVAQPYFAPGHLNLADLFRTLNRNEEAAVVLEAALGVVIDKAVVQHALGLTYIRLKRTADALKSLHAAAETAPGVVRYGYVYAVALFDTGKHEEAIAVLRNLSSQFPADAQIQGALASFLEQSGNKASAGKPKTNPPTK